MSPVFTVASNFCLQIPTCEIQKMGGKSNYCISVADVTIGIHGLHSPRSSSEPILCSSCLLFPYSYLQVKKRIKVYRSLEGQIRRNSVQNRNEM